MEYVVTRRGYLVLILSVLISHVHIRQLYTGYFTLSVPGPCSRTFTGVPLAAVVRVSLWAKGELSEREEILMQSRNISSFFLSIHWKWRQFYSTGTHGKISPDAHVIQVTLGSYSGCHKFLLKWAVDCKILDIYAHS